MLSFFLGILLAFETVKFNPISIGGVDYISYKDIADLLKCSSFVSDTTVELFSGTKKVRLSFEKKVAWLGNQSIPLENVYIDDNTLFLDGESWAYILSWFSETQIYYWDYQNKRYIISKYPPSVKSFKLDADSIVIEHNRDLSPVVFQSEDTIYVFIKSGFYSGLAGKKVYGEFVKAVRTRHTTEGVTFLITVNNGVKYIVSKRLMSIVLKFQREGPPGEVQVPEKVTTPEVPPIIEAPKKGYERNIKVVVIDPGHGGHDPGAVANGIREKDVVLQVSKLIKKKLERMGIKVVLTRSGDYFVSLGERARIAQKNKADLYVSIHCNYAPGSKARGVETFFLSEARTEWERSVAAFENSVVKYEVDKNTDKGDILSMIIGDMAQYEFLKESQDLAYFVQESLVNSISSLDRGVKQAGFYVLQGVYAPSVLVELGFLTNKDEAKKLKDTRYQEKLADAIVDAIIKFKVAYERS
ncbi:MAG TPA: N-acetylmuramoyl-L-alanine amidase [Candidatus Hydrothermia bacterium]|nr:N-acetylmuramoyl-L-alanine amidase [Candidatus Hydrothermia bacterium]